jgi:hypothetical protein
VVLDCVVVVRLGGGSEGLRDIRRLCATVGLPIRAATCLRSSALTPSDSFLPIAARDLRKADAHPRGKPQKNLGSSY